MSTLHGTMIKSIIAYEGWETICQDQPHIIHVSIVEIYLQLITETLHKNNNNNNSFIHLLTGA